jgi:DNA polymerase-1
MLLQVHELVFDVHNDELKIKPMIKHEMEHAFQLDVPLEVDLEQEKIGWKRIKMILSQKNG